MNIICRISIDGKTITAQKGLNLGQVLAEHGYDFAMPCGGKGICRKCKIVVDGKEVLACRYIIAGDINVALPEASKILTADDEDKNIKAEKCYIAVDIGTTTIAVALVDSKSKKVIKKKSFDNPQKVYGADVISRIHYCHTNGTANLTKVLRERISKELTGFADKDTEIQHIYFSGNTTMLHTLTGEDCSSMGFAPYTPKFLCSKTMSAKELGLVCDCPATTLPSIAAFVGSDILAGLLTLPCPAKGKYNILIDMGTNAEVVLFDKDSYIVTATSAGPCFEGANISCGMTATDGAIKHFTYPDKIQVIGDTEAKGLCGTGLIDAVAELYKAGIIDYTGYMEQDYEIADGVALTKEDIRQYQLAKSAIRAGVEVLLEEKGTTKQSIDTVYLAGGFSGFINIHNAVAGGLIEKAYEYKCKCIGNSSLAGCVIYPDNKDKSNDIIKKAEYVDLTQKESFSQKFIEYMFFDK